MPVPSASDAGATLPPMRWEWRTFRCRPGLWQLLMKDISTLAPVLHGVDTYLVGPSPDHVKLHRGHLEVKRLAGTDADGLERWRPILRCPLPCSGTTVGELCDMWRLPRRAVDPAQSFDRGRLLGLIRTELPEVHAIPVRKWRWLFRLGGCDGERVMTIIAGTRAEGLALEHPDPAHLRETLRAYRLLGLRNTSYATLLRSLLTPDGGSPGDAGA